MVHFTERKQFQTDISVDCLQSQDNVMHIIIDNQILHL